MKILQICKKFPYPAKDGESVAILNIAAALKSVGCRIDLLAMNTTKHWVDNPMDIQKLQYYDHIYAVPVDNRLSIGGALSALVKGDSYHVSRYRNEDFARKLVEVLKTHHYDVVQMETVYLSHYVDLVRAHTDALIVLRAHNVEHEIWQRITKNTRFAPKRWYLSLLTQQLKNYELEHFNKYDFIVAISNRDMQHIKSLGYNNGTTFTPVGVKRLHSVRIPATSANGATVRVGFIGSLDWMPNLEGIHWFLNHVWPSILKSYSNVELHIAGRNTPTDIFQLHGKDRITVHGEVPDAEQFVLSCDVMIVPLFSGSGMRVKIIESMLLGRPIVTTSIGLEGIPARHEKEILIADSPNDFICQLSKLIEHPNLRLQLAQRAQQLLKEEYDLQKFATELVHAYRTHLATKRRAKETSL